MTSKYVVSLLSLALLGKTLHFFINNKKRSNGKGTQQEQAKTINSVLFFPDIDYPCPEAVRIITKSPLKSISKHCRNPSCKKLHGQPGENPSSLIQFLDHLASAKKSVDLCIYLFTQGILADLLRELHARSVRVRVITDSAEDDSQAASQIERLRTSGIVVKSNKRGTGRLMHHKFVVVDGELLLSGSFNWTNKAVVHNYEAVLVTNESNLVGPFCEKFNELWQQFEIHPTKKRFSR